MNLFASPNITLLFVGLLVLVVSIVFTVVRLVRGHLRAGFINVGLTLAACAVIAFGLVRITFPDLSASAAAVQRPTPAAPAAAAPADQSGDPAQPTQAAPADSQGQGAGGQPANGVPANLPPRLATSVALGTPIPPRALTAIAGGGFGGNGGGGNGSGGQGGAQPADGTPGGRGAGGSQPSGGASNGGSGAGGAANGGGQNGGRGNGSRANGGQGQNAGAQNGGQNPGGQNAGGQNAGGQNASGAGGSGATNRRANGGNGAGANGGASSAANGGAGASGGQQGQGGGQFANRAAADSTDTSAIPFMIVAGAVVLLVGFVLFLVERRRAGFEVSNSPGLLYVGAGAFILVAALIVPTLPGQFTVARASAANRFGAGTAGRSVAVVRNDLPSPTPSDTPVPSATPTLVPSLTPVPSESPTPMFTAVAYANNNNGNASSTSSSSGSSSTPTTCTLTAETMLNLRGDPSINQMAIGRVFAGSLLQATGQSADKKWWRVISTDNGVSIEGWVSADFVKPGTGCTAGSVPVVTAEPSPTRTSTATQTVPPSVTPRPSATK